jgi:hypothetical protein
MTPTEELYELADELRGMMAGERRYADKLVAEDGSAEARRKAKSIRIKASLQLGRLDRLLAWVEAERAKVAS